jgi:phytanoyl-CoA hydroxylase
VRKAGDAGVEMVQNEGSLFPKGLETQDGTNANDKEYTIGPVEAGSLVLIHGNILHKSEKNLSQKGRIICELSGDMIRDLY